MAICRLNAAGCALPGTLVSPSCAETTASIVASGIHRGAAISFLSSVPCIQRTPRHNRVGMIEPQTIAILADSRRTLRPQRADQIQPALQPLTEFAGTRILGASELAHQTEIPEQRNPL